MKRRETMYFQNGLMKKMINKVNTMTTNLRFRGQKIDEQTFLKREAGLLIKNLCCYSNKPQFLELVRHVVQGLNQFFFFDNHYK